ETFIRHITQVFLIGCKSGGRSEVYIGDQTLGEFMIITRREDDPVLQESNVETYIVGLRFLPSKVFVTITHCDSTKSGRIPIGSLILINGTRQVGWKPDGSEDTGTAFKPELTDDFRIAE